MDKIKAGVIGSTGYAGAELCRIILGHERAELSAISSVSYEGMAFSDVYKSYIKLTDLVCENQEAVIEKSDVIFAALPHGLSQEIAYECAKKDKVFIDIGADFRLNSEQDYEEWYNGKYIHKELHEKAVYGLPEFFMEDIKGKKIIANPGCYTTAVPLALVPALQKSIIKPDGIIADCKSGVTGAGRKPSQANHYPELNESFYAYKVASHRHTPEIEQTLGICADRDINITFVPHLLPVNRGILATCYAKLEEDITYEEVQKIYEDAYGDEYFIRLLPQGSTPNIRDVRYTNFCDIGFVIDKRTGTFIVISAIDNMVKGAAGQAVQNMNLCFGFDETAGLEFLPPMF